MILRKVFKIFFTAIIMFGIFSSIFQIPAFFDRAYAIENMIGNQSQNEGMFGVPASGKVEIDGNLDEWDWSGRIRMFGNYDITEKYGSETAVMYDNDYCYLGFKVKDLTPMQNKYDPVNEAGWTFKGDCVQLRISTDQSLWLTIMTNKTEVWQILIIGLIKIPFPQVLRILLMQPQSMVRDLFQLLL